MKAIVLRGANQFKLEEVERPVCPEGGMLLKVNNVGLCGSDLRKLRSGPHAVPVILGHEVVGTVVENRSGRDDLPVGTRIMPCIAATCGKCYFCKNGMDSSCANIIVQALGYTNRPDMQGGFAEYMPISAPLSSREHALMLKLPDSMTDDQAVMIEPYTNILCSLDAVPAEEIRTAVIIGAGAVGTMYTEVLKQRGVRCVVADLNESRLEMMERVVSPDLFVCSSKEDLRSRVMEFTDGLGADLAVAACSSAKAEAQSLEMLRPKGHSIFFSGLPDDNSIVPLDGNLIHYRQLNIHGVYGACKVHFEQSFALIRDGKVHAERYVDHVPFERFADAVEMMEKGSVLKPVFSFS